jgi:D-aminopeptidase
MVSCNVHERIRDLGYDPGQKWLQPGPLNSITDVEGVCVGVKTLISGSASSSSSSSSSEPVIRTGVTAILPRPDRGVLYDPVYTSVFQLNGTGEMTSSHFISEVGTLHSPILLGGTTSLGSMIDATAKWNATSPEKDAHNRPRPPFVLPCVAETSDNLSDQGAFPITVEHATEAILAAHKVEQEPSAFEGSQGGGTGMSCQGFKGGNGTSSRLIPSNEAGKHYTLGAFVQANFGTARDFIIGGLPIGKALIASGFHGDAKKKAEKDHDNAEPWDNRKDGSIIVILATDMPLMPHQLSRLCRRIPFGLAHVGAIAHSLSGDIFLAFSTQSTVPPSQSMSQDVKVGPLGLHAVKTSTKELVDDASLNTIFYAVADVVEEAVLNALCAAKDMQGANGMSMKGLPHEEVKDLLAKSKEALKDIFPGAF